MPRVIPTDEEIAELRRAWSDRGVAGSVIHRLCEAVEILKYEASSIVVTQTIPSPPPPESIDLDRPELEEDGHHDGG